MRWISLIAVILIAGCAKEKEEDYGNVRGVLR